MAPSPWILVCGFALALFLGFGKRRMELVTTQTEYRALLDEYSPALLDMFLSISGGICLITYMLFSIDDATVARHHTENLIYTIPFVFYGIFRYLAAALQGKKDGPVDVFLNDRLFLLNGILWVLAVVAILATTSR
ncbi:MAG: hypothetical protein Q4D38_06665 [Planctomycetia bacterium]|nr:hypothetical protein [Planctomycetia bacterium]